MENLTEIVFILDRSGSMSGLEADTIGGFNSMIDKQRKEDGEAYISTVLFDDSSEVIYDRVPVNRVEPMKMKQLVLQETLCLRLQKQQKLQLLQKLQQLLKKQQQLLSLSLKKTFG